MAKKLRFGIVGMTSDHIWALGGRLAALPAVEFVAGADPHEELRERAVKRFNLKAVYADDREMYEKEQLDAILVCSDNAAKAEIVEHAAARGVHVSQDKPIAATLVQADRIVAAAGKSGIKVMVAYHNYFNATYGRVKELLNEGRIGSVYLARAIIGHAGPREVGCDPYFCEWLFQREKNGGGTFVDEACYGVSAFLDYLGPVTEVVAFTAQIGSRDYLPPDVEDNSVALLRFNSGALGVIDSKWGQIGPMPFGSSYHGTDGTITVGRRGLSMYSRRALPEDLLGWLNIPVEPEPRPGIGSEAEYFVNCLLEDRPIEGAVSARAARDTQEVIEAVYRSAATGQAVKLRS
ncbi:MAG: Gfo/Idh/MocA family oxidoreductase [Armatimonadetes bacterium]|nr:Gfo/Idh/MocA family oxidoreductase [Armatimonadota bacterium]